MTSGGRVLNFVYETTFGHPDIVGEDHCLKEMLLVWKEEFCVEIDRTGSKCESGSVCFAAY